MNKIVMGIDPGGTTGLAVASLREAPRGKVLLPKVCLRSLTSPGEVLKMVRWYEPHIIFVERRANHPSMQVTVQIYETILAGLDTQGYTKPDRGTPPTYQHFLLIQPGHWKPIIKSHLRDFEVWKPQTDHERDAMGILLFGIFTAYPRKRVQYV